MGEKGWMIEMMSVWKGFEECSNAMGREMREMDEGRGYVGLLSIIKGE